MRASLTTEGAEGAEPTRRERLTSSVVQILLELCKLIYLKLNNSGRVVHVHLLGEYYCGHHSFLSHSRNGQSRRFRSSRLGSRHLEGRRRSSEQPLRRSYGQRRRADSFRVERPDLPG